MKTWIQTAVLLLLSWEKGLGQDVIYLQNPSFELDAPAAGMGATGWKDMGASTDTPPDIQPGAFSASLPAQDGKVYLGLVTRDINTWEGVGQELDGWLKKDSLYAFSLWLARERLYLSTSKLTGGEANYDSPVVLKIWGVNTRTGEYELLAMSDVPEPGGWKQYAFTLKPTLDNFDEINLMAYYAPGYEETNGNLLIDNCSPITKTSAQK